MVDDTRTEGGGSTSFRGFLFADVRGFTAFAERYGNAAAAAMVGQFLDIARRAISRYEGAEIMTEGDAIHAVFPSASSAVLCGLEIVDAAAEANEREPDRPLGLGVGVHAGEAVETAEGYIGRAVNIAARLCAAAGPGEVLVSSTVKGITQSSIPVGFIARGNRRLKGISDPILVYAVTRDMTATASARVLPRLGAFLAVAGIAAVAIVVVVALSALLPGGSPSEKPSAGPSAQPVAIGALLTGTYAAQQFQPATTFTIVDPGWSANRDTPSILGLLREQEPPGSVYFLRVQEISRSPCIQGGDGAQTGPGAASVITQLGGLTEYVTLTDPQPVEVGGFLGQQVEVTIAEGALAACGGVAGAEVAMFKAGDEYWDAAPGERFRLVSLPVNDQDVTIVISSDWSRTPSVQQLEALNEHAGRLLQTVAFPGQEPASPSP